LFKVIGSSKTLILVRGYNIDSFAKAIASLSGYIKKNGMDIKIMTIVSSQAMAFKLANDKNSFGYKLLSVSKNFNKHEDAILDIQNFALQNELEDNTKNELIPNLNI